MNSTKILIVEDELKVANFIKRGLEENDFEADIAYDGLLGLKMTQQNEYQLILLDINIPIINGFELCKEIRKTNNRIPILMLTALSATDNKVMGFESGADDYLVKPFEFRELIARIKSLLKRSQEYKFTSSVLKIANLEMNTESKIVKRGNDIIDLTAKEFLLLEYLLINKGRVVSRVDIAEKIWDITFDTGTNVIDVYVNFIRKKVDKNYNPKLIHTIIGMGYVLREGEL
jgi:DNA-binding response OmpR family regulator